MGQKKQIVAKNFLQLIIDIKAQIQEAQRTPNGIDNPPTEWGDR